MKKTAILIILLVLMTVSCSKDKVKPSPDSIMYWKARDSIYIIKTAYQNKDRTELRDLMSRELAESIISNLSFHKAKLSFIPRIARIKESTVMINLNWHGTWWKTEDEKFEKRGVADLTLQKDTMKLINIEGDSPFLIFKPKEDLINKKTPEPDDSLSGQQTDQKKTLISETADAPEKPPEEIAAPVEKDNTSPEPDLSAEEAVSGARKEYYVQVGAWKEIEYAREALDKLSPHYPGVYMYSGRKFNKVRIPAESKKKGALIVNELKEKFQVDSFVVLKTKQGSSRLH